MKTKIILPVAAILLAIAMVSCQKEIVKGPNTQASNSSALLNSERLLTVHQPVVNLGMAGNFAILSKSGITDVYKSDITGDIGTSPITGAAIHLACAEVVGTIYSVDAAGPLPCRVINASRLGTAIGDMQTAYTNVAGRSNPDYLNLGAGNIGGRTLTPGLYKWTSALIIPADVTIAGGPNDVWIFQVAGTLNASSAVRITLTGGAQAKNIFWQAAGAVTLGTTSHFEGIILGKTGINLLTGASINGRLLAQTAVTLEKSTVTRPANSGNIQVNTNEVSQ